MSARPDTWMPLYIGDYLADTMHLDHAQHGIYVLLIMAYWRNGGPIANASDELAAIARCTPEEWQKNRSVIVRFFHVEGGCWRHKRIDAELQAAETHRKAKSKAGKDAANKRWQAHANGNANALPKNAPSPSPSSSLRSEELPPPSSLRSEGHPPEPPQPETMHHAPMNGASLPHALTAEKPHGRGTRLAADWQPSWNDCDFATARGLDPGEVADAFCDYWAAVPGARGCKRDWAATWRNWCRRQPAFARNGHASLSPGEKLFAGSPKPPQILALVAKLLSHYWTANDPEAMRKAQAQDWLEDIIEFDVETVAEACREWRRSSTRRPVIAEIRTRCREIASENRAHRSEGYGWDREAYAKSVGFESWAERQQAIEQQQQRYARAEAERLKRAEAAK